jgi:hypothetical protein
MNIGELDLQVIPLDRLHVDERYQRPIKPKKLQKMAAMWDPNLCGVLDVAADGDGNYAVWDGQHRLAVLRVLEKTEWVCSVSDKTPAEQADAFIAINGAGVVRVTALERHQAALFAGHQDAIEIEKAATEAGYEIGTAARGRISAVGALNKAHRSYGHLALTDALTAIHVAFGDDPNATRGEIIGGVTKFVGLHADSLDLPDMNEQVAARLRAVGPRTLVNEAKSAFGSFGGSGGHDVYRYFCEVWNRKRRSKTVAPII